jgi:hypothetical protein
MVPGNGSESPFAVRSRGWVLTAVKSVVALVTAVPASLSLKRST